MDKNSQNLEPVLEAMLQSHEKNGTEQNRLLEHGIEMSAQGSAKIAEKVGDVAKAISEKKDDGVRTIKIEGIEVITLKGDKGDDGKDADEQKIIDAVSEKLPKKEEIIAEVTPSILDKVPKIEDIVAQVVPKIEPGAPGDDGDDGKDADPNEVATLLKNDPAFVEKTKGKPGEPGNDGSPDTGEQIVIKLSQLTDEKRLSYLSLKDLPEIFRSRGGSSIGFIRELTDVSISSEPSNGQALAWSSTLKKWIATTIISGGSQTPWTSDIDGGAFNLKNFFISKTSDSTAKFAFDVSTLSTGTTRNITIPDRSLTLDNITTATTTNLASKAMLYSTGSLVGASQFYFDSTKGWFGFNTSTPASLIEVNQGTNTGGAISNSGVPRVLWNVDFNYNPTMELQAGNSTFGAGHQGFACYIDFAMNNSVDYNTRMIKWGNFSIGDDVGIVFGAPYINLSAAEIGFYGYTPIPQQDTSVGSSSFSSGLGTPITDADTFDGYTLAQVVYALRSIGLLL